MKFVPAGIMKSIIIYCKSGENAAAEEFFVEYPPEARVEKAWLRASKKSIPHRVYTVQQIAVSTK